MVRAFLAAGYLAFAVAAPAAAEPSALKERLVMEAARAAQYEGARYAFTVDFNQTQNKKTAAFKARYDPRLEEGAQWALEGTSLDALDEHTRKTFENLQKSPRGDDGLVYDKLGESMTEENLQKLALQSETEKEAVFTAPLDGDDVPEDTLELVIHFDKEEDYVARIDLRTVDDFKPNPAVKINSLVQSQYFSAPEGDGPALLARSENVTTGSAMFRKFKSDTTMTYSDIEVVTVPPTQTDALAAE